MIEDKDIKVGNIVYLRDEKISCNSEDGMWTHEALKCFAYLSRTSQRAKFKILEVKDSVHIKPMSEILMVSHEPFGEIWIWKDAFKRFFDLDLSEGTEALCKYINEKRKELQAKDECKDVYPSDKLINIIEDYKTAKFALIWIYDILINKKNIKEANSFLIDEFNDECMNTMLGLIAEYFQKNANEEQE